MKRNHGITLVALVITIIILIILAGVSINIVLGEDGIIAKAKQARKIQDIARILEKLELEKAEVAIKNGNIVRLDTYLQYIQNKGIIEESDILDSWNIVDGTCYILVEDKYIFLIEQQENDLKITYVENPVILKLETQVDKNTATVKVITINTNEETYEYSISTDKVNYDIKETLDVNEYTFAGLTENTQYYIKVKVENKDGTSSELVKAIFTSQIQPGHYVSYTPTAKTFEMTTAQTGYRETQQFNTADYTGLWQVLYNDSTNGLQLISADSVGYLYLNGGVGYNEVVDTLNTFSRNYENTEFTVENAARIVGTNLANPADTASGNVIFTVEFNGSTDSGLKTEDATYTADYETMKDLGINNIGGYYWLGSRKAYHDSEAASFSIYTIASDGSLKYRRMKDMYAHTAQKEYEFQYAYGVRPIVKLQEGIKVVSGDGKEGSALVLTK